MSARSLVPLFKSAAAQFYRDNILTLSAALAYYAIFSIGPLLAIAVGVAGMAFGTERVHHEIHRTLVGMLGENSAKTIDSMVAARAQGAGLITTIIGVTVLIFGAVSVFGQLQFSLNTIWKVQPRPKSGIAGFVRHRLLSLSMVMAICFLLLTSLAISVALASLTSYLDNIIVFGQVFAYGLDMIISLAVITLLFGLIFKYLPDVKVPWDTVWVGAILTSLLFSFGKFLLGLYLGKQSTASAYGAAGSVILILMWVYYASVIFLFGAEFTRSYALTAGVKVEATKYAELTDERKAQKLAKAV